MKHLKIFEDYGSSNNPAQDGKKLYAILNPGQIQHFRQVFRLRQAKDVDYAWKVLDTIEKNGGRCSFNQWTVLKKTKEGENYSTKY
jgi:hypothetical protein